MSRIVEWARWRWRWHRCWVRHIPELDLHVIHSPRHLSRRRAAQLERDFLDGRARDVRR